MSTTAAVKRSKTEWGKAKLHTITLPSGFEVEVQVPNLPSLIKTGQLPNHLIDAALGAMEATKITREMVEQQAEFYEKLVVMAVTDPVITDADVADLPFEDIELIVEIATRNRDVDALGRHIGGLHTSNEWRTFRGLDQLDADLEGV